MRRVYVDTSVLFPFSVMDLVLALAEDSVHVESAQSITGDDQQLVVGQRIDVADLAAMDQLKAREIRVQQRRGHGRASKSAGRPAV